MTVIKKSELVAYSSAEMYALVDAIDQYPAFLPGCKAAQILSRTDKEVRARIQLEKKGIQQSFSTINLLHPHRLIEVRLLEGPFRHLSGSWRFDDVDKGCQISFYLEFELSNRLLDKMVGPILQGLAGTFVEAFSERAALVYGRSRDSRNSDRH